MLIIRKIIHCKNSLKRKLLLPFEVESLRNLVIVKEFAALRTYNTLYLQYTKESFQQLKTLFPELKIIASTEKEEQNIESKTIFTTHLLENAVDIRFIQELLEHANILTTVRYTHVSVREIGKVQSPLDKLGL